MVKSIVGNQNKGLQDWLIQRSSAILIAIYSISLLFYFFCHPNLYFGEWHSLFSHNWMKVATIIVLIAILWHAWVGMWTIFTDYIKPFWLRTILNFLVMLMLIACFFWGLLILWSV